MKNKMLSLWCPICQKYKSSHNYYRGVILHERTDIPDGIIYFINENYIEPKIANLLSAWSEWICPVKKCDKIIYGKYTLTPVNDL